MKRTGTLQFSIETACDKKTIAQRYKVFERECFTHNGQKIIIVKLWTNEQRQMDYHITITIINGKLIYTGDCGTFVFGNGICSAKPVYVFFCGDYTNPRYWREKCESFSEPFYEECVDLDKVDSALHEFIQETYPDATEEALEDALHFAGYDFIDSNQIRAYDCVKKVLAELADNDAAIDAASIIDSALVLNARYLYACEVIQYVCNKLAQKDLLEGNL